MLYRKLMSVVFALSLILTVSQIQGSTASGDAGKQRSRTSKAKRITSKKKKVNQTPLKTMASATEGVWGGDHIRLALTDGGAEIEYDCAHGKIDEPLVPDSEGRFDAKGTHVRGGPGPIRVNIKPATQPARYTGTIKDGTMTLSVTLAGRTEPIGTFTLTRGSEGRLWKCR